VKFYDGDGNDDLKEFLQYINIKDFLNTLVENDILESITENYSIDCFNKCEWASSWLSGVFINTKYAKDILVYDGFFRDSQHSWIEYKGYFIDITLSQFIDDVPQIAILKKEEALNEIDYQMDTFWERFKTTKRNLFKYIEEGYAGDFVYRLDSVKEYMREAS